VQRQFRYGPFETAFAIPPEFDLSRAKAAYQNGILHVRVPRRGASPAD